MERRLLALYEARTPQQDADGRAWYKLAHLEATCMALMYHVTVEQAAGVIAAYSPRHTWGQNLKLAHEHLGGKKPRTMSRQIKMAGAVLHYGPFILSGPKVTAFYRAIMGDRDALVVDTWMLKALGLPDRPNKAQRAAAEEAIRHAAIVAGVRPAEFQAIVWCVIRGKSF